MNKYKTANKTLSKFTLQAYNTAMSRRDSPQERLSSLLDKAERINLLSDRVATVSDKILATGYIWGLYAETQSNMQAYSVTRMIPEVIKANRQPQTAYRTFSSEDWNQRNTHDKSCYSDIDNALAPPEQIAIMLRHSKNYTTSKTCSRMTDDKLYSVVANLSAVQPITSFVSAYTIQRDKVAYTRIVQPVKIKPKQCLYPQPYQRHITPSVAQYMRHTISLRQGYSHMLNTYY